MQSVTKSRLANRDVQAEVKRYTPVETASIENKKSMVLYNKQSIPVFYISVFFLYICNIKKNLLLI